MSPRRPVLYIAVLAATTLGLSACSSDKPSSLATSSPGLSSQSPSPTTTSKWTPEQQQVIAGYDRFNVLMTAIRTKAEKIDLGKAHEVGREPFVTGYLKGIDQSLATGYVSTGKPVSTTSMVTVAAGKATLVTCLDVTHTKWVKPGDPSAPTVRTPPPTEVTVTLVKDAGSWLVSGLKAGEARCVRG